MKYIVDYKEKFENTFEISFDDYLYVLKNTVKKIEWGGY